MWYEMPRSIQYVRPLHPLVLIIIFHATPRHTCLKQKKPIYLACFCLSVVTPSKYAKNGINIILVMCRGIKLRAYAMQQKINLKYSYPIYTLLSLSLWFSSSCSFAQKSSFVSKAQVSAFSHSDHHLPHHSPSPQAKQVDTV
jgi:hypothetical protein